ncbi:hypothetical protein CCY99_05005 [Helicobacter sp. 16-1353]|uniref:WD40 repeat domain-containing protein n=1 Tax=Helicobacter sp. 16-1353 TaxID=2004996 RepID=UPI000DCE5E67|nr:hypothetical protein [Helicobacter sp. 16-1353]RAX54042.1 hypothetical protein CCY99_05005 [Helicobacter sp. 16-1353]
MIEPVFNISNEFSADSINLFQNSIFAFDFKEEVYWISDILDNNSSKTISINIAKNSFNSYKISICKSLPLFAYIDTSESNAIVVDTQQAKAIRSFKIQDSKIESISISDNGDTILIGGKNGLLSRWNIYNGKLLDIPNRHKDFILFAKESPNKRFVVSVGYDRSVILFDKYKDKVGVLICVANSTIKCARFFDDCKFLALGDTNGVLYIINTDTKFIVHKFQATFAQIIDIYYYKDSYIFYLNDNGVIGIVNFSKEEKILDSFMPNKKYKSFIIDNDLVVLASVDKNVCAYNLHSFVEYGISLLQNNNVADAYEFVAQNKFLQNEDFYLQLEAKFEADILEAKALACSKNQLMALDILNKYLDIPDKHNQISTLIANIKAIDEFQQLMNNNMEIRAIPMVAKNPILRELKSYIDFKNRFGKVLILAKELVKKGKKTDANTVMMHYKKIPSKIRTIQEVISYPQKVDEALQAIKNKDYKTFFRLKKDFQFVGFLQESKNMMEDGEKYYYKLLQAFYEMDLKNCKYCIGILKNFKEYKELALELEFKIDEIANLLNKIKIDSITPK